MTLMQPHSIPGGNLRNPAVFPMTTQDDPGPTICHLSFQHQNLVLTSPSSTITTGRTQCGSGTTSPLAVKKHTSMQKKAKNCRVDFKFVIIILKKYFWYELFE